jgi:DUF4097 and DUF4098 domain-containing protein YvlB
MLTLMPFALMAVGAVQQQTDTTIAVAAGTRLQVSNYAGTIQVTSWDRNAVRIRAMHGSRDRVDIEARGAVVTVEASRRHGEPAMVDYDITVPRAMPVDLQGTETDITVAGVGGDLRAQSVEGGIVVRDAGGAVTLSTVEGEVELTGGRGTVRIDAVEGAIRIAGTRGDVVAETVEGDVTLEDVDGADMDVSSVEGAIYYRGVIRDGGRYRFTSHEGDVTLGVPAAVNATVSVATFDGSFEADPAFRVQITEMRPGRRFSFVLGTGSARVELESFEGAIRLERR